MCNALLILKNIEQNVNSKIRSKNKKKIHKYLKIQNKNKNTLQGSSIFFPQYAMDLSFVSFVQSMISVLPLILV